MLIIDKLNLIDKFMMFSSDREWKRELDTASKHRKKPRLWKALIRVDFWEFLFYGWQRVFDLMLRLVGITDGQLLSFFKMSNSIGRRFH